MHNKTSKEGSSLMRRKKLLLTLLATCLLAVLLTFGSIAIPAHAAFKATPQQWHQTGKLDGQASCLQGTTIKRSADNAEDQAEYDSGWNEGFHGEGC
jgi:hypothetical protein